MIQNFFNCVVDVQFMTDAPRQTSGGFTPLWQTVAQAVACRIEDASGDVREEFARQQLEVTHTIFTTMADLTNRYRLVNSDNQSTTWLIKGVKRRRAIGTMPEFWVIAALQMVETAT